LPPASRWPVLASGMPERVQLPGAQVGGQRVQLAADLAGVARHLAHALLVPVQLFERDHRQVDVVLLEAEQRHRVVHQHVGVEHEQLGRAAHRAACARSGRVAHGCGGGRGWWAWRLRAPVPLSATIGAAPEPLRALWSCGCPGVPSASPRSRRRPARGRRHRGLDQRGRGPASARQDRAFWRALVGGRLGGDLQRFWRLGLDASRRREQVSGFWWAAWAGAWCGPWRGFTKEKSRTGSAVRLVRRTRGGSGG
jgi:hypothetical protein